MGEGAPGEYERQRSRMEAGGGSDYEDAMAAVRRHVTQGGKKGGREGSRISAGLANIIASCHEVLGSQRLGAQSLSFRTPQEEALQIYDGMAGGLARGGPGGFSS